MLTDCLELLSAFSGIDGKCHSRLWMALHEHRSAPERAIYLTRQLCEITALLAEPDWALLEYVLEVADSSMTYRTRYYTTLQPLPSSMSSWQTRPILAPSSFQLKHLADLYRQLPRHLTDDLHSMQQAWQYCAASICEE